MAKRKQEDHWTVDAQENKKSKTKIASKYCNKNKPKHPLESSIDVAKYELIKNNVHYELRTENWTNMGFVERMGGGV